MSVPAYRLHKAKGRVLHHGMVSFSEQAQHAHPVDIPTPVEEGN